MGAIAAAYPIATAVAGGAAATYAVGEMTKPKMPSIAPPVIKPPTPMPDEKAVKRAGARASILEQSRRRGRAASILTDGTVSADTDALGG